MADACAVGTYQCGLTCIRVSIEDPVISTERHLIILAMDFTSLKINILQVEESLLSRATENLCSL